MEDAACRVDGRVLGVRARDSLCNNHEEIRAGDDNEPKRVCTFVTAADEMPASAVNAITSLNAIERNLVK